jgi:hypothetical protein
MFRTRTLLLFVLFNWFRTLFMWLSTDVANIMLSLYAHCRETRRSGHHSMARRRIADGTMASRYQDSYEYIE